MSVSEKGYSQRLAMCSSELGIMNGLQLTSLDGVIEILLNARPKETHFSEELTLTSPSSHSPRVAMLIALSIAMAENP